MEVSELTLLLGKIFGVFFIVNGVLSFVYIRELQEAIEEFSQSKMLFYLIGQGLFITGLSLAFLHTSFDSILSGVVTVVGYLVLIKGIVILCLPHSWIGAVALFFNKLGWYIAHGVLSMLFGGALLFTIYIVPLLL